MKTRNIAYFDCFHGAAGDMLLASLLDAGLEQAALETALARLPLAGYTIVSEQVVSHHIRGRRVRVVADEPHPARTWADIRAMLQASSGLSPRARAWALGAFGRLARAEAAMHGVPIETVHFHEVGALDSIVDMVGVCVGLDLLGVEAVYASALPLGSGWVATQHGLLPVPAPATLSLLAEVGAPTLPTESRGELLTPTAAALLAELAHFEQPPMHIQRVGYGFGQVEFDRLNGLRVWLGEHHSHTHDDHEHHTHSHSHSHHSHSHSHHTHHEHTHHEHHHHAHSSHLHSSGHTQQTSPCETLETVVELRCNLDDVTGEVAAYTMECMLAEGALDAWAAPLLMKKGRPAVQLACLSRPADVERLARLVVRETPTLGVRWEPMERLAAERRSLTVETPWGQVRLKQKLLDGRVVASTPEYEDCAALARRARVPLALVYKVALEAGTTTESEPTT